MLASSSYVPFHSQVDPVYFETSNNLQIQQERSTFSQTRGIQCTPSSDMVKVELQDSELWRKFHHLTNEMIVNKQGRLVAVIFVNALVRVCCLLRILLRLQRIVVLLAGIWKVKDRVNILTCVIFPQIYVFDCFVFGMKPLIETPHKVLCLINYSNHN